jgi:hypothetical protein
MVDIRDATAADLDEVYTIWYQTEIEGVASPPPPSASPWFRHLLAFGRLVVASDGHVLVGFAAVVQQGPLAVLTDCFVRPNSQSTGVGTALLDAVLPPTGPLATLASADPRAVSSYARRRMVPRWPAYYLSAPRARLGDLPTRCMAVAGGTDGLRYLVDARTSPDYLASIGAVVLEVRDGRRVIGAATVTAPSRFRVFGAELATVTESAAEPGRALDTLLAVINWCVRTGSPGVSLQVAGCHEAFPRLLGLGFHITDSDTACASDDARLADPTRTSLFGEPLPPYDTVAS